MQYKVLSIKQKIFFFAILYTLFCILYTPQIKANSFDLSVSPQIFQVDLTPPAVATAKQTITLENNSDNPLPLSITYRPFKPQGDNGNIVYLKENERIGNDPQILDKIIVSQNNKALDSVLLPPKTKKQLDLTVSVPSDEPPGDYYVSILFLENNASSSAGVTSTLSNAIGGVAMNVLLSIGPKGKTTGKIEDFSTDFLKPEGPVSFKVTINNTSPHFIAPQAQIIITNMFGQKIGKIDLLPLNILAHSSRSLPSKEQFVLAANSNPTDNKQIEAIQRTLTDSKEALAVWPETFLLGPYKATLTVAFSDEGPLYVKSIYFLGVPIYVLGAFFVCLVLIVAIRARLKHHGK